MDSKELFFMVDDEELIVKKQSFVYHDVIKKEYNVISFAACQKERTPNGRACFIAVLVENEINKKVLLIDLLNPYFKAHTIYTCDKNTPYDRISFFDNSISLWVDDPSILNALQIVLPNEYKRGLLFLDILKKVPKNVIKCCENLNTNNNSSNCLVRLFSKDSFFKIAKFFCCGVLFLYISMAIMAKAKNFF